MACLPEGFVGRGNPTIKTLSAVLKATGLKISVSAT
jgi:DNA-binding phage protein